MDDKEDNILKKVDSLALEIVNARQKPLFVLYYPESFGLINTEDISDVYDELRRGLGTTKREKIDVLLHTYGGDPGAAYRIVQSIRSFTKNISVLVPFHAYSAGTLMCLGANKIQLGAYAALSPIDIHIPLEEGNLELIAVDKYIEFVKHCKEIIEGGKNDENRTDCENPLLVELVKQIGSINIGIFFRERELTKYYAEILLDAYMLNGIPDINEKIKHIVNMLVFKFPSHQFEIDYHIANKIGLVVDEMPTELSDKTKSLIKLLELAKKDEKICKYVGDEYMLPYFRVYDSEERKVGEKEVKENES